MPEELYIAIDIGATKTRIALCSRNEILDKVVYYTPKKGNEYTIANLIIETVLSRWRNYLAGIRGMGVASIGPLDVTVGRIVNTPNLEIKNIEVLKPLAEFFKVPVFIANDCVASAWAERNYGDAVNTDNFVYVTLSTGVGAGVIVDGELLIGKMGNAHEVGHLVIDFDSELRCGCGGRGHWEAYAGGANLPRLAKYLLSRGDYKDSELARLVNEEHVDAKVIFDYYRRGDRLAKTIIDLYIKATAAGLASLINAYDPELITIGGSVFLNNIDILYEPIVKYTRENIVTGMPVIKPTRFGEDIGLYGGLALAVNPPRRLKEIQSRILSALGISS